MNSKTDNIILSDPEISSLDIQNIIVDNIDVFIYVFKTCNLWKMNYPDSFNEFISNNKETVLSYLYSDYQNVSSKRLINNIIKMHGEGFKVQDEGFKIEIHEQHGRGKQFGIRMCYANYTGIFDLDIGYHMKKELLEPYITNWETILCKIKEPSEINLENVHRDGLYPHIPRLEFYNKYMCKYRIPIHLNDVSKTVISYYKKFNEIHINRMYGLVSWYKTGNGSPVSRTDETNGGIDIIHNVFREDLIDSCQNIIRQLKSLYENEE